jgi:hypothetical protein
MPRPHSRYMSLRFAMAHGAARMHTTQDRRGAYVTTTTPIAPPADQSSPPIRFVRMSGAALHFGVKEYPIRGASLKVYTPAKTVADCFKFRNKIGMDVALEALRECRRLKKASIDDLWAAAKVCRVANIMRPYLESL